LLVSAEMLHGAAIPQGLSIGSPDSIELRGRQTPVEAYTMHRRDPAPRTLLSHVAARARRDRGDCH